jgi:hypothetical protein
MLPRERCRTRDKLSCDDGGALGTSGSNSATRVHMSTLAVTLSALQYRLPKCVARTACHVTDVVLSIWNSIIATLSYLDTPPTIPHLLPCVYELPLSTWLAPQE